MSKGSFALLVLREGKIHVINIILFLGHQKNQIITIKCFVNLYNKHFVTKIQLISQKSSLSCFFNEFSISNICIDNKH